MKNRIFMYLFIFSVLLIVFQYVNSKNIIDKYEVDIKKLKSDSVILKDSIVTLSDQIFDLSYFKLSGNEDAMSYFERQDYRIDDLVPAILDALYATNEYDGEDHPLVPYASMTEQKILINKARILNHRWIIANYTDGQSWGEIFINYNVDGLDKITFKLTDYLLYPSGNY